MNLGFCPLASSSSGNCYLVKSDKTNILVDIGISGRKIIENLEILEIKPYTINGVVLTHEHGDHVRSIGPILYRSPNARVFATAGTVERMEEKAAPIPENNLVIIQKGDKFMLGDIEVGAFEVSHDAAEPIGYYFKRNDKKIAIVTDTGKVTEEIEDAIKDADILVIEANHEVNILLYGSYPYNVKYRILSEKGHLSNETAGECICRFLKNRQKPQAPYVFLAHLSKENNTPQQAFLTVRNILEEEDFYVGRHLKLEVIQQKEMGDMVMV